VSYIEKRAAENRANCTDCGRTDNECTDSVVAGGSTCCAVCAQTDTHPKPVPLARNADPDTSHEAAEALNLKLKAGHWYIYAWLQTVGSASDLEMAEAAVDGMQFERLETARRAVRTLREVHGLMIPAIDDDGAQILTVNTTGREAVCWSIGDGTAYIKRTSPKEEAKQRVRDYLKARGSVYMGSGVVSCLSTGYGINELLMSDLEILVR